MLHFGVFVAFPVPKKTAAHQINYFATTSPMYKKLQTEKCILNFLALHMMVNVALSTDSEYGCVH
jgi:hypothetical protein